MRPSQRGQRSLHHNLETFKEIMEFNNGRIEKWQKGLKTGDLFCQVDVQEETIYYGIMLELLDKTSLVAKIWSCGCPEGEEAITNLSDLDAPLKQWQFQMLSELRWPCS